MEPRGKFRAECRNPGGRRGTQPAKLKGQEAEREDREGPGTHRPGGRSRGSRNMEGSRPAPTDAVGLTAFLMQLRPASWEGQLSEPGRLGPTSGK